MRRQPLKFAIIVAYPSVQQPRELLQAPLYGELNAEACQSSWIFSMHVRAFVPELENSRALHSQWASFEQAAVRVADRARSVPCLFSE